MEKLTVVIPTWNNQHCLQNALFTMRQYTEPPECIIVANNGDKDKRAEIKRIVEAADFPTSLIAVFDENLGDGRAFNEVLPSINTEFVASLNDDVLFVPSPRGFWESLTEIASYMEVGGVGPCTDGTSVAAHEVQLCGLADRVETVFLHGFCTLWRTEAIKDMGGFDGTLPGGYDVDLSIRMRSMGYKLVVDRRVYLRHIGNVSVKKLGHWKYLQAVQQALKNKHGEEVFSVPPCLNGVSSSDLLDSQGTAIGAWLPQKQGILGISSA